MDFSPLKSASHAKEWQKTFFYCKDTSPAGQPRLLGYRAGRLTWDDKMKEYAEPAALTALAPTIKRIKALLAHGLKASDLTRCWVGWFIQPLSIRSRLFGEYIEQLTDSMRYSTEYPNPDKIEKLTKRLI